MPDGVRLTLIYMAPVSAVPSAINWCLFVCRRRRTDGKLGGKWRRSARFSTPVANGPWCLKSKNCLAGVVGFEPTIHGTKNRCLTTWLHPTTHLRC